MNAAEAMMRAKALEESTDTDAARAVRSVVATHDALVVEMYCPDHDHVHALVVCNDCGLCDGRTLEDEDCPLVQHVAELLGLSC